MKTLMSTEASCGPIITKDKRMVKLLDYLFFDMEFEGCENKFYRQLPLTKDETGTHNIVVPGTEFELGEEREWLEGAGEAAFLDKETRRL